MPAMRIVAVHFHRHFLAELLPAGTAMAALRATLVVMHHHAIADRRFRVGHAGADGNHHAARFMPGDGRTEAGGQAGGARRLDFRPAILMEIGSAHAGGFHLEHDLTRPRRRVGEVHDVECPVAREHDAAHGVLPCS
jgi:hypothetical protein